MKLGVITSLWAWAENLSLGQTLERIAALGIRYVDILGFLHGDRLLLSPSEKRRILERLQSLSLIPCSLVLLPPGNIASQDESEVKACWEYIRAGMEFMAFLGGDQVLFNGGKRTFSVPHQKSWDKAVTFMRRASEYAQEAGVFITLEAEPYVYFLVNDLDSTLRMVGEVDHPHFLAAVDLGHMNLSRDAPWALERLKGRIAHIHLSENDGLVHANQIIGTGTVPTGEYLQVLRDLRVEEECAEREIELVAALELGVGGESIDDPDSWVRRSVEYVTNLARFLEF